MKMEMSYRDKIILVVVGIVVILAVGIFVLIKPKYGDLQNHKVTRDEKKTEWQAIETKLDQIDPLKDTIKEKTKDAQKTAEIFVNTAFENANKTFTNEKNAYQLDQYIQKALDESKLEVNTMELGSTVAKTVSYYYYTPDVVTYSLLEAADVNGKYATAVAATMLESTVLAQETTADVMCMELGLSVAGTKEQLMTFLDAMKADTNAIQVTQVNIDDYTFSGGLEDEDAEPQFDEEGNQIIDARPAVTNKDGEEEGTSKITIILSFYNAVAIDDPILGD